MGEARRKRGYQGVNSKPFDRNRGQVMTPPDLIEEMLDTFPKPTWSNPFLTWLEPSFGTGNFLFAVHRRLMEGLASVIPDPEQRDGHIWAYQIYGVELTPDLYEHTIKRLGLIDHVHNLILGNMLQMKDEDWPLAVRQRRRVMASISADHPDPLAMVRLMDMLALEYASKRSEPAKPVQNDDWKRY